MATRFEIQVSNGAVTITVDGQSAGMNPASGGNGKSSGTASGGNGKSSGTASGGNGKSSGTGSGGGEPGSAGCCAPVVIGPIVISGGMLGSADGDAGGNGKSSSTASGGNGKSSSTASGGNGKSSGTGSGGGEPGFGGCCAPVVIGPIVISDCCSGQAADPNGYDGSTAVSVNPPAGLTPGAWKLGSFIMEPQQETYWCWAAVAVSINAFLNPANFAAGWTQETLATALMQKLGNATANCSDDPGGNACNQPEPLDVALSITRNLLLPSGAMFNEHLTFESLQNWFTTQLPVAARIKWRGGGAHFIALDACKVTASGRQLVHVQDPNSTASSSAGFWDYDVLVEEYQEAGFWNDTYLVGPAILG